MKYKIPTLLIYTRLLLGWCILTLSIFHYNRFGTTAVILLSIGLLSDIFDGIIARNLSISTQKLRRLDSTIDQIFFISVALATYIECPTFFKTHVTKLAILFGFELTTYVFSFLKFKKEIATHSLGAKFWTLILFATLIQIILTCESNTLFEFCFWIGLFTRIEIIAIILILKKWTNDVPSVYHAIRLRNGKTIKTNKLFNG